VIKLRLAKYDFAKTIKIHEVKPSAKISGMQPKGGWWDADRPPSTKIN